MVESRQVKLQCDGKRNPYSWGILVLIAIAYLVTIFTPNKFSAPHRVIHWDVKSYYSYLPAYFIDHDIGMTKWEDQYPNYNKYWPEYVRDDKFVIKTTLGISIV